MPICRLVSRMAPSSVPPGWDSRVFQRNLFINHSSLFPLEEHNHAVELKESKRYAQNHVSSITSSPPHCRFKLILLIRKANTTAASFYCVLDCWFSNKFLLKSWNFNYIFINIFIDMIFVIDIILIIVILIIDTISSTMYCTLIF